MYSGKVIQSFRKLKGLSQKTIAKSLGLSQQAYAKWEKQEWLDYNKINKFLSVVNSSRKELEAIKKFILEKN